MIWLLFITIFLSDFTKIYKEGKREEIVKGKLYYIIEKDHFYINVNYPVNQILTKRKDTLLIYYPKEKKGFKIITFPYDLPLGLNFFKFIYAKEDTIFQKMNLIFVKKGKKKDTLIIEWMTKENIKRNYIFKKVNNIITDIIFKGEKNNKMHVKFNGFFEFENKFFPKGIKIYFKLPFREYTEEIKFINVKFLEKIPDSIMNFKFPKGTEIKIEDLRWKK